MDKSKVAAVAKSVSFLKRSLIPFCIIVVLMFACELASSIPRGIPQAQSTIIRNCFPHFTFYFSFIFSKCYWTGLNKSSKENLIFLNKKIFRSIRSRYSRRFDILSWIFSSNFPLFWYYMFLTYFIVTLAALAGSFYCAMTLATSIFFFWNGARILTYFKTSTRSDKRTDRLISVLFTFIFNLKQ